jgi:hypothetical protein
MVAVQSPCVEATRGLSTFGKAEYYRALYKTIMAAQTMHAIGKPTVA